MNRPKLEIENEIAQLASGPWFREARLIAELLLDIREHLSDLVKSTEQEIVTGEDKLNVDLTQDNKK